MIRILALCGSLRRASLNRRALRIASELAPPTCEVALWEGQDRLPMFSPDLDGPDTPPPSPVREFVDAVGAAHGLLIACPEYAHGIPGAFKNSLDWLVGSTSFPGKPVALLNIAPRARHAPDQLREVLATMSAVIVEEACCTAAFPKPEEPRSADEFEMRLRTALAAYATWLQRRD